MIGEVDVASVNKDHVVRILRPIWLKKPETAYRLRGRMENVLDWCRVLGGRQGENPALWRGHLKHLLPAQRKNGSVRHHPALPWKDIPAFMAELRSNSSLSARALELTVLTGARTREITEARWTELDLCQKIWTIPAERMKARKEHRVPLCDRALALLSGLPRLETNPYVFPGARLGRSLSNMAMLEPLRGLRPGFTVHGFRSTFKDWAAEKTDFAEEVSEAALAHAIQDEVEAAYRRGDLFEKRRSLMMAWEAFCQGKAP